MQNRPLHIPPLSLFILSVATFLLAAFLGPGKGIEPFYTWFFSFAWWSYILAGESILAMRQVSLLFQNPRRFFWLLPLSLLLWLLFEACNFRLSNWHYLNLPADQTWRWVGYILSFATVLPGLLVTKLLLEEILGDRIVPLQTPPRSKTWESALIPLGLACLILPLTWPRYFFPLIWAGVLLVLEPVLDRAKAPSFLSDFKRGDIREALLWLAAGALCGLLWEMWNYWAGGKWYYTVPFVGETKLFEMPILGFFGFPPFALSCASFLSAADLMAQRIKRLTPLVRTLMWAGIIIGSGVFVVLVLIGIDRLTVDSFHSA